MRVQGRDGPVDIALRRGTDGTSWTVTCHGLGTTVHARREGDALLLRHRGFEGRIGVALAVEADAATRLSGGDGGTVLRATMPGTVVAIHVAEGDEVVAGQVLVVLESMKLFMELKSPASGSVERVAVKAGETVAAGQTLIAIEPPGQPAP